jgi:putative oxidoreductase
MRTPHGMDIVRIATAAMLLIHGVARIESGGVLPFGEFLSSQGLPFGVPLAVTLTAVEIVGAPSLAAGLLVVPLCAWFAAELLAGILMVHGKEGWFVVGGGRNGMEYSVLLIVCLAAVAWDAIRRDRATV